jgi:hypothetical protein
MGLLMGAFGAPAIMTECSNEVFDPAPLYYKISDCSIAIVIVLFFDQLVQVAKPGRLAHHTLLKAWQMVEKRLVHLLNPSNTETDFADVLQDYADITDKFNSARDLGVEALDEPRLWRTPWEAQAFDGVVSHALSVKRTMNALERIVSIRAANSTTIADKRKKRDVFTHICKMPSFQAIKLIALESMLETSKNLDVFIHEVDTAFQSIEEKRGQERDDIDDARKACMTFVTRFREEATKDMLAKWNDHQDYSLSSDAISLMAVVLTALKAIIVEVNAIDDLILQI